MGYKIDLLPALRGIADIAQIGQGVPAHIQIQFNGLTENHVLDKPAKFVDGTWQMTCGELRTLLENNDATLFLHVVEMPEQLSVSYVKNISGSIWETLQQSLNLSVMPKQLVNDDQNELSSTHTAEQLVRDEDTYKKVSMLASHTTQQKVAAPKRILIRPPVVDSDNSNEVITKSEYDEVIAELVSTILASEQIEFPLNLDIDSTNESSELLAEQPLSINSFEPIKELIKQRLLKKFGHNINYFQFDDEKNTLVKKQQYLSNLLTEIFKLFLDDKGNEEYFIPDEMSEPKRNRLAVLLQYFYAEEIIAHGLQNKILWVFGQNFTDKPLLQQFYNFIHAMESMLEHEEQDYLRIETNKENETILLEELHIRELAGRNVESNLKDSLAIGLVDIFLFWRAGDKLFQRWSLSQQEEWNQAKARDKIIKNAISQSAETLSNPIMVDFEQRKQLFSHAVRAHYQGESDFDYFIESTLQTYFQPKKTKLRALLDTHVDTHDDFPDTLLNDFKFEQDYDLILSAIRNKKLNHDRLHDSQNQEPNSSTVWSVVSSIASSIIRKVAITVAIVTFIAVPIAGYVLGGIPGLIYTGLGVFGGAAVGGILAAIVTYCKGDKPKDYSNCWDEEVREQGAVIMDTGVFEQETVLQDRDVRTNDEQLSQNLSHEQIDEEPRYSSAPFS